MAKKCFLVICIFLFAGCAVVPASSPSVQPVELEEVKSVVGGTTFVLSTNDGSLVEWELLVAHVGGNDEVRFEGVVLNGEDFSGSPPSLKLGGTCSGPVASNFELELPGIKQVSCENPVHHFLVLGGTIPGTIPGNPTTTFGYLGESEVIPFETAYYTNLPLIQAGGSNR